MAKQTPTKGEPAKQVAIDVLSTAGEPLHAKEIAKRVLESGRTRLTAAEPQTPAPASKPKRQPARTAQAAKPAK